MTRYTQWYSDVLLRRVSAGHICFSNTLRSFVSLSAEGAIPFNAEEFTDPTELRSLAELLGDAPGFLLKIMIRRGRVSQLFQVLMGSSC